MSSRSNAHRAGFTVRCACGNEYHSDDTHIGRRIRCRCGRTVVIERPAQDIDSAQKSGHSARKTRKSRKARIGEWRSRVFRSADRKAATFLSLALHDFAHPRGARKWTTRLTWLTFVGVAVSWVMLAFWSESLLPAMMLAYGPRAVMLAPLVLLAPFVLLFARRALLPFLLSAWIVFFPIMGARFSPTTLLLSDARRENDIRIVTFNTLTGFRLASDLDTFLAEYQPDVVGFQECGPRLWEAIEELKGWQSDKHDALCTLSRWPMKLLDTMPRPPAELQARIELLGGYGSMARYTISTPQGSIVFSNLHLPTARYGLQALLRGDDGLFPNSGIEAIGEAARRATGVVSAQVDAQIESNTRARELASERASRRASGSYVTVPVIAAGDFNLPVESTIFDRNWGGFDNAFEIAGNGLGYTKIEGKLLRIRIDHVLFDNGLAVRRAVVGKDWYSDHRPVIVDLYIEQ